MGLLEEYQEKKDKQTNKPQKITKFYDVQDKEGCEE